MKFHLNRANCKIMAEKVPSCKILGEKGCLKDYGRKKLSRRILSENLLKIWQEQGNLAILWQENGYLVRFW